VTSVEKVVLSLLAAAKGQRVLHVCAHPGAAFQLVREWSHDGLLSSSLMFHMNDRRVAFVGTMGSVTFCDSVGPYRGAALTTSTIDEVADHSEAKP